MSDQPALSICCGFTATGLSRFPNGLQIVGHRFGDLGVSLLAATYEFLRDDIQAWPLAAG